MRQRHAVAKCRAGHISRLIPFLSEWPRVPERLHSLSNINILNPTIGILTQGNTVASSRFRIQQHVPSLTKAGLNTTLLHAKPCAYPPLSKAQRPTWLISALVDSYQRALQANQFDICILQRELISTLFTFEASIKIPLLLDVDDAIFLKSRFNAAKRLAKIASLTICGNSYLADYFSAYGPVEILPTAVDTDHFKPDYYLGASRPVIGWSGASSGFKYLYSIEQALNRVMSSDSNVILMIVADVAPNFTSLPNDRVVFKKWSLETEVSDLQKFTIGLMPLIDGLWERGKCSFKMLTYMAIGIPVVVSPIGMNVEVLEKGACGHSANSTDNWVEAILSLLKDETSSLAMGKIGRQIAEDFYSSKVIGCKLGQIIKNQL